MIRTFDRPENTERVALPRRSGVIAYRRLDSRLHVLLITSRMDGRWIIPKGRIDPNMTAAESAAKEAYEEAGVMGRLNPHCRGTYVHRRGTELHEVEVYELEVEKVLEDWPEKDERRREWCSADEALRRIDSPRLLGMIQALTTHLDGVFTAGLPATPDINEVCRQQVLPPG